MSNLARETVPIYAHADKQSSLLGHTPPGVLKVDTHFSVTGFDGQIYWFIQVITDNEVLSGYVEGSDIAE